MKPAIYDHNETEFRHNGHGILRDTISCFVEEEINGLFDFIMEVPVGSFLFEKIKRGNILKAHASDKLRNQLFRIRKIDKPIDGIVKIYAKHITFDLARDSIVDIDIKHQSCEYVLNEILRQSEFCKHFKGYSDIEHASDYKMSKVQLLEGIVGKEGSVLQTYGTAPKILRDNFKFCILKDRGEDNNVLIAYGKNLTGFDHSEDDESMITRIYPYAKYRDDDGNEIEVTIKQKYVDSPRINDYDNPYSDWKDFSDKFEDGEIPTESKLIDLSKKYFSDNKCDLPKITYSIEFIPLSRTENYKDYKILEEVGIGDKIHILNGMYKMRDQARVVKTKYNVLTEMYELITLGEPKTTLGDLLGNKGPEPGPPGSPGKDGEKFPDTLPEVPQLTGESFFGSISLEWTYESKAYYTYELYASQVKGFSPNAFDLIHKGQSSSYLHNSKPEQTWYFRVRAVNSYGKATNFSDELEFSTFKIEDGTEYFGKAAMKDALIGELRLDRGWVGKLSGNWIDARLLTVTDGNGKRTFDIDDFGRIYADFSSLTLNGEDIRTTQVSTYNMVRNPSATLNLNNWGAFLGANCKIKRVSINVEGVKEMPTKIHFIDIGDGLCVLIESNGKFALIDTGKLGTAINKGSLEYVKSLGIKEIDYFIITHHHSDHIGECERFLSNFNVKNVYTRQPDWSKMPAVETGWQTKVYYDRFYNKLKSQGKDFITPFERQTLWMSDECALEIFNTNFNNYAEYNDLSFGVLVRVGARRLFIAGDISYNAEAALKGKVGHVDYLCGGHHAYNTSNSDAWLDELSPTTCIFTSENIKGSSQATVVNRVKAHGIEVYSTNLDGTIVVTMDSKNISHNAVNAV